jgi:hypothetical protein
VYDCSNVKQADIFIKTTKKLSEYVGKKFKEFPGDMQALVKNQEMPTLTMPVDPPATATLTEKRIWEKKCDSYAKREEALEQNLQRLYALILGQCTGIKFTGYLQILQIIPPIRQFLYIVVVVSMVGGVVIAASMNSTR